MPLRTQLVHAEAGRRVVRASAWEAGECLGSALGEAASAEEAEDRAIERLRRRLALVAPPGPGGAADPAIRISAAPPPSAAPPSTPASPSGRSSTRQPSLPSPPAAAIGPGVIAGAAGRRPRQESPGPSTASTAVSASTTSALPPLLQGPPAELALGSPAIPAPTELEPVRAPAPEAIAQPSLAPPGPDGEPAAQDVAASTTERTAPEPPPDPEDWSDELAQLELELQRLGWGREQEAAYLERTFGHPSRGRLTRYADLTAYLVVLRRAAVGADPAALPAPMRRRDLLEQSDLLLEQLHWEAPEGRTFLERHFALSSRQQLSDEQLLHFNLLLEEEVAGQVLT